MMTNLAQEHTALELTVSIEFSQPQARERFLRSDSPESQEFERLLLSYLGNFVEALGLPLRLRLEISQAKNTSTVPKAGLNVRVADRPCRLPICQTEMKEATPDLLARFVARAVAENRETLVSEELVTATWPVVSWSGGETTDTVKMMQGLKGLRELVHHGYALSKLPILLQRCSGSSPGATPATSFEEALWAPDLVGVEVALGPDQIEAICTADQPNDQRRDCMQALNPRFDKLRLRLFDELGIILPKIKICSEPGLGHNGFRIRLNDLLLSPEDGLQKAEVLVDDTVDRLASLAVRGHSGRGETMKEKTIVDSKDQAICRNDGIEVWTPADWVVRRIEFAIRERSEMFLTTFCIDNLHASSPHLVEAIRQRIGMPTLLRVLEGLLEEGLSIRDLRGICESILAVHTTVTVDLAKFIVFLPPISHLYPVSEEKPVEALDTFDYLNCVRMAMKPYILHKYAKHGSLIVYLIDPQIEERLKRTDENPLSEGERRRLLSAVDDEIGSYPQKSTPPVILTTMEIRRKLWNLIEREFRRFPVLSYQELFASMNIQPIARITWD